MESVNTQQGAKILLLEDSPEIQRLVKACLPEHTLMVTGTLAEARNALRTFKADLMLLDIMVPDGESYSLIQEAQNLPEMKDIPVIFLTSKSSTGDKVLGLSLGVDDYITKPFDPMELKARIHLRLSKSKALSGEKVNFTCGNLSFNLASQKVLMNRGALTEKELDLSAFEFRLLVYLAKHVDHVLSRDQFMQNVWQANVHVLDRSIDSHVSNLRKKLTGSTYTIQAVYGEGYRFSKQPLKKKSERMEMQPNAY